jgi:hypothetical protein
MTTALHSGNSNPSLPRPLGTLLLLLMAGSFAGVASAKSVSDTQAWFAQGGKAWGFRAELDGPTATLGQAARYIESDEFDRYLARTLKQIGGQPSVTGQWCELDQEGTGFRYRARDEYRPLEMAGDWGIWPGMDRNLRWRHHSLGMAGCHVRLLGTPDEARGARLLKDLVSDWFDSNAVAAVPDPEFSWGDHSTPIRLRQVIAVYLLLRKHGLSDEQFAALTLRVVHAHTRILLEEPQIRMRRSNHALDQANALFLSGAVFPFLKFSEPVVPEAYARALYEAEFLVAPDGVQTENSPEYHRWVPNRAFSLLAGIAAYQQVPFPQSVLDRMTGATWFAAWITRPDGTVPPIGDTGHVPQTFRAPKQASEESKQALAFVKSSGEQGLPPDEDVIVFKDSGYLIHRSAWSKGKHTDDRHLVYKCGFLSSGHRQDDDGNVVLYEHGTDWLVDAGLYGYERRAPEREYVRSPLAHNVSVPLGMPTIRSVGSRRYKDNRNAWGLAYDATAWKATCRSFMYAESEYTRVFTLKTEGFTLEDSFDRGVAGRTVTTLFRIPTDKQVTIDAGAGQVQACQAGTRRCMRLEFDPDRVQDVVLSRGTDDHGFSFATTTYLEVEDVQTVRLFWRPGLTSNRFDVWFPHEAPPATLPKKPADRALPLLALAAACGLLVVGGWRHVSTRRRRDPIQGGQYAGGASRAKTRNDHADS